MTKPLIWIDLVTPKTGRTSSLQVDGEVLRVTGNLPHNTSITLKSQQDADRLRAWLDKYFPTVMAG